MTKLWSSASIRVYGGGEVDPRFLGTLSQLIGDYEARTTSISVQHGRAGDRSTTTSTRVERILEVSDLAALPIGRAVVFASGTRPILVQTEPWYAGPQADRIRAAMARPAALAVTAWTGYDLQPGTPKKGLQPATPPAAVRAAITRKTLPSNPQEPK
jgi:type IV secretory pathway TraG/TraD family ATPase VirD4